MIRDHHRHIPIEIHIEIIKRINDLKSLIRLRSVSKPWKSLIDSKDFIAAHTSFRISRPETQRHRLLLRYGDLDSSRYKCISFVDDDSFRHDQNVTVFAPDSVPLVDDISEIIGGSHGLFCVYDTKTINTAVIWNPSIRKSVAVALPNVLYGKSVAVPLPNNVLISPYWTRVGFGVCPRTLDPKLVKINYMTISMDLENSSSSIPHQVEVFTLSSGSWRSPLSSNLPHKSISFGWYHAVIDGFIYWDASVATKVDGKLKYRNLVMSFDLTSEEFRELYLPGILAHHHDASIKVSKLRDSLAVIEVSVHPDFVPFYCAVWMMTGHGYSKSFKMAKLFTVDSPDTTVFTALGFTKSGAAIIVMDAAIDDETSKLAVYEPCSQHKNDIGIYGVDFSFSLNSYIETLLLLDQ